MRLFLSIFFILVSHSLYAGATGTLRIVGRMPASVDIAVDRQANLLTARANFPFLMSYSTTDQDEGTYVVRVANESVQTIEDISTLAPFVLEIIAP